LLHKAPTGQRSTTLPASLFSSGSPGKNVDLGMVATVDNLQLGRARHFAVKRTQREHMMQRSVNSEILSLIPGLLGGVFFSSTIRLSE